MKHIAALFLALLMLLACSTVAEPLPEENLEAFLTKLYTIETIPAKEETDTDLIAHVSSLRTYLSDFFGAYCTQEVLDEILNARFPFRLTDDGSIIQATAVELEMRDPETAGEGRWLYSVTATVTSPGAEPEEILFSGRLTLDPQTGLISDFNPNDP